jgi:hypothetical protein
MRLNQAIGHKFADSWEKAIDHLRRIQKLDADGEMFPFHATCPSRVNTVVGAEACVGADDTGPGHSVSEEEGKNLRVQEIFKGTCIFVEVNDHLLRRTWRQHSLLLSWKVQGLTLKTSLRIPDDKFRRESFTVNLCGFWLWKTNRSWRWQ